MSHCSATRGLLANDLVILNHCQVTRTKPKVAPQPRLTTTPHRRMMYKSVVSCITNQIRMNCGIEASRKTLEAMIDSPDDIRASCNEPATNDVIQALFDRRKK
ncbi:hypothetical protein TNCV_4721411 [Trichonephila clavipes]|uniref:Uncharacterized protein n=1 Tax=Trichonephila clavipes TaxID=2585209 RepID=A0A8X7BF66_TRICX|nr:hypothetical protein TNCV_4721411 [Trichonephila clavipes]